MNNPHSHSHSADRSVAAAATACPGLLRIVPAMDGGICRIRLACGRLTTAQARSIADASERWGSGVVEITNRANLQLRGIELRGTGDAAGHVVAALLDAGLGPLAPGADDVRNVLVSPTAGSDVAALIDTSPLALQLLELLQTHPALRRLSPKFAIALDGGERAAALEHPHDLWLAAMDAEHFAVGLAGCAPVARDDAPALAMVPREHALALIEAVLLLFLECAQPAQTRLRDVLTTLSPADFLKMLQQRVAFPLRSDAAVQHWRRTPPQSAARIGIHAQRESGLNYVGALPALGRIDAAQLRALAALADEYGADLRATPWQGVVLANIPAVRAAQVLERLQSLDFCGDDRAVIAHTIACTGSNGCAKGRADTKGDALWLAQSLERHWASHARRDIAPPSVHLTGCERSCAAPQRADFTLLATSPGHYTLYRRDAGHRTGFGRVLAQSVDIATALAAIAATFSESDT